MSATELALIDLVIANRVLARMGAVDAYGHVSLRHPTDGTRFLLSRSRSPEFVEQSDIMEFDLDGRVVGSDNRPPYLERFIHAGIYAARADANAVVHGHARVLIPFTVTDLVMRPVFMTADEIGSHVPVWDIRARFGDSTDMLITNMDHAADLADTLGADDRVVLLRGHGFIAAARSASQLIRICRALLDNAAVQLEAMRFGALNELTAGEIAARRAALADDESPGLMRAFEYEAIQAGLSHLLERRAALKAQARPPGSAVA
jgi:HCOMODA/2-hydroxy-3-carboxy-muconic semialdehyde decarboxylase